MFRERVTKKQNNTNNKISVLFKEKKFDELIPMLELDIMNDQGRYKIWNHRNILRKLPIDIIRKSPTICSACGILAELSDDFEQADKYMHILKEMQLRYRSNSIEYKEIENYLRCIDIELSHRSIMNPFHKFKLLLEVIGDGKDFKFKPTITLNRPSLLNGARDNYRYVSYLVNARKPLNEIAEKLYSEKGMIILNVALAEALYQENKISKSLLLLANNIPIIERKKDADILFVALYLRYSILVMTGQLDSVFGMIDTIKQKLIDLHADYLNPNLDAIIAWTAMLNCDYSVVDEWMKYKAPDENSEYSNLDRFQYFIKLRVYLLNGKHLLLVDLAERLLQVLTILNRSAELCELYTILAMSYYDQKDYDQTYYYIRKAIDLCKKYKFYRIIANEGSKVYILLRDYACENAETDVIIKLMQMSKEVGLYYPDYLKPKLHKLVSLTATETDVLRLLCAERTNAEIGDYLNISLRTVKFHTSNIFEKLNVKNRQQASKIARKYNIV